MRVPALKFLILLSLLTPGLAHGFGLHAGGHIGFGQMGNTSHTLEDRSVGTFDAQILPGYRLGTFLLGPLLEYRSVNQISLHGGQSGGAADLSGSGTTVGAAVSFEPGMWKFLLGFDISSNHSLSSIDKHYKGTGVRLLTGYQFMPKFYIDFAYTNASYNRYETGGTITEITTDKVKYWNFSIGVSLSL